LITIVGALRSKQVSSREMLDTYLQRAESLGREPNAIVSLAVDRAVAEASLADERAVKADWTGPLHGVPFTVKDALLTEGIRSTCGSPDMAATVPDADALAVRRLRKAGAVLFGKTNTPIWCGDAQTYNELFGTTSNPWDKTRTTGGSSGGSAAAVAAGLTSFDVGTDIGGSVRLPAHFCGVCSHKPTFGLVPQNGYIGKLGGSIVDTDINVIGPLARSADDLGVLLDVMATPAAGEGPGWSARLSPARPSLSASRIAFWFADAAANISSGYSDVLSALVADLARSGARVEESHPPIDFAEQVGLWLRLLGAAGSLTFPERASSGEDGSHYRWLLDCERRVQLTGAWKRWFQDYDVLLCPVWAREAFDHDHEAAIWDRTVVVDGAQVGHVAAASWLGLIGVVGLPSTVVPIGTVNGMPVGVQVVVPHLHDQHGIRVAAEIATITGGYRVPPGF